MARNEREANARLQREADEAAAEYVRRVQAKREAEAKLAATDGKPVPARESIKAGLRDLGEMVRFFLVISGAVFWTLIVINRCTANA